MCFTLPPSGVHMCPHAHAIQGATYENIAPAALQVSKHSVGYL